jgi:signal transduction histidine kinase
VRDLAAGAQSVAAELLMSGVRTVGLVFAVPAVATTPRFPGPVVQVAAWALVGVLAVGTLVVWLLSRRTLDRGQRATLTLAALVFDIVVVSGFVLVFSYEVPNVTWALLIALPFDGALRYGWRGAVVVAVVSELVFLVHSYLRVVLDAEPMTTSAHLFVVSLLAMVAGVTALLVEVWHRQTIRYREQAAELDHAHHIRDRLMAVTSHEIRGSLAAIGSTAALLQERRDGLDPERVERLLDATRRQVEHLLVLVDDLLVTGRSGERGLDVTPAWGDLGTTTALALSAAERSRRGHRVDTSGVQDVRCELDHQRVQQVVRNLVENAFKYSPEGSAVTVSTRPVPTGVELTVADHGDGIAAERQAELFEPFQRGPNAGATHGAGLGLYVVRRIVSACAGTVEVSSAPGDGTRFVVTLPCWTAPVGTDLAAAQRRTRE